ncbi:MAG: HD domain-containing protein [Pyrinomonadaceae bacterium]
MRQTTFGETALEERIYRDPVHNIIRLEPRTPDGALLARLIDTAEFQRLRRIRQLGLAHFAYQGAEHSRFTHSLGVMHIAQRILARLSRKYEIDPQHSLAVRIAALLHDIGHGAFSHVLESILHFHHEDFTVEAVLSPDTEVGRVLAEYSSELPEAVAGIIRGDFKPMALAQLVSSQLDVDRMDYLLRDSLMTGAKYGIYDFEWIVKSLEIDEENDRLYVSARGIYAVEDYLQSRYYMFRQVYFHRTLRSAEVILKAIVRRALFLTAIGHEVWKAEGSSFATVLNGLEPDLKGHLELDDSDIIFHIKRWLSCDDSILRDLSRRFLHRKLFKVFDLDMPSDEIGEFIETAREIVSGAGFDPEYYFLEDRAGDAAHYFYTAEKSDPKNLIYAEDGYSRPTIREISEISAAVRGLQKGYQLHRICFPYELADEISVVYHNFG